MTKNLGQIIEQSEKSLSSTDQHNSQGKESAAYLLGQIAANMHNASSVLYKHFGNSVSKSLQREMKGAKSP